MNNLETRMYGLVPYNISPIQQAIQYGHAVVEYANTFFNEDEYQKWATKDKTFIILNGGTTNKNHDSRWYGTLNQHLDTLINNGIRCEGFYEPDLGEQLTAVVFIVDERVFNKADYPDFKPYFLDTQILERGDNKLSEEGLMYKYPSEYNEWVDFIGGEKNAFLKTFLRGFKLA
jgi:hypothetical protein